jgi:hypothetical protein
MVMLRGVGPGRMEGLSNIASQFASPRFAKEGWAFLSRNTPSISQYAKLSIVNT